MHLKESLEKRSSIMSRNCLALVLAATSAVAAADARASDEFGLELASQIASVHAEGAQIYECRADASGTLAWAFREPVATLVDNGQTVGRHFAGPTWELADGTRLEARVVAQSPGAEPADIPLLKLAVHSATGTSPMAAAKAIVRTNTKGGVARGHCTTAGALLSVPYSADYLFFDGSVRADRGR